jgi:hypothetical protein
MFPKIASEAHLLFVVVDPPDQSKKRFTFEETITVSLTHRVRVIVNLFISVCTLFLSVLYFCLYFISVCTLFLSVLYFCLYFISVCTLFLSVLYFCLYFISVCTLFLSVLYFFISFFLFFNFFL